MLVVDDAGTVDEAPGVSLIASAWRRLRRDPVFLVGAGITLVFVVFAIISPWIAPHDPAAGSLLDKVRPQSNPIPGPEPGFPLGADDKGRDFLSRLLVGSRQTLIVGVLATLIGLIGGLVLGILAGAFGGGIDSFVMRVVDVLLSIPSLLLALSIAALASQPSQWTVIIAIAVVQIPVFARLLRGSMLAQRSSDHVLAARALGVKRQRRRLPAHGAQLARAGHRAGHPGARDLDHRRRRPVLPRPGQPRRRRPRVGPDARPARRPTSTTTRTSRSTPRCASSSSRSASP